MNKNLESSLSNKNIDFSNLNIIKSYEIPISGGWSCIAMSSDGKYQFGVQSTYNGQSFLSSDYGITWTLVQYLTDRKFIGNLISTGISSDGKYIAIAQKNGFIAKSGDYGVTWSIYETFINTNPLKGPRILNISKDWRGINVSGTGQYMVAVSYLDDPDIGGFIYRSSDYGQSWGDYTQYDSSVPRFYNGIAISYTGQIQTIIISANSVESTGEFYTSSYLQSFDYGVTWTQPTNIGINSIICAMSVNPDPSLDGKYQYICEYGGTGIYASSDYGTSWKNVITDSNIWTYIATSADGKYVYCSCYLYFYAVSDDYGDTWKIYNSTYSFIGIATSGDGSIVAMPTLNNQILLSYNYANKFDIRNNSPQYIYIQPVQTSSSGQYQTVAIKNGTVIESDDFGRTFKESGYLGFGDWYGNAMSISGQYQIAIYNDFSYYEEVGYTISYFTNKFGEFWFNRSEFGALPYIAVINGLKMSGNGKYISVINGLTNVPGTPAVYNSSDYGIIFTPIMIQDVINLRDIAMSLSGKYQTVVDFYGINLSGGAINISTDYGLTFKEAIGSQQYYWNNNGMSSSGKYQLATTGQKPFYYGTSNNYGETWKISNLNNKYIIAMNRAIVSSTGQYQFISTTINNIDNILILNVYIYYSIDYGNTWNLLDTSSIDYIADMVSISSDGQIITLSNQNQIYNIYLNQI